MLLINQEKKNSNQIDNEIITPLEKSKKNVIITFIKIVISAIVIALSASGLVGSAEVLAIRIGIPDVVIASTLVAFGTGVPELTTCISAARRKHGGLAVGNIMGANILNILMVVGASVSLTSGGIAVTQEFYKVHFLALGAVVAVFGYFAYNSRFDEISKKEGTILILIYTIYVGANLFITL